MNQEQLASAIAAGACSLKQELSSDALHKLVRLLEILEHWAKRLNLTAIRDRQAMVSAHVLDSLSIRPLLQGPRIVDVGTGAGFPGLPLAIAEPQFEFQLLDSNGKKLSFVQHIIGELGLTNVSTLKVRVEDYAPANRFDTVIARAFASTPRFTALAGHLVSNNGVLLAQKGKYPADELEQLGDSLQWTYEVIELTVPGVEAHARHVVCLRRVKAETE